MTLIMSEAGQDTPKDTNGCSDDQGWNRDELMNRPNWEHKTRPRPGPGSGRKGCATTGLRDQLEYRWYRVCQCIRSLAMRGSAEVPLILTCAGIEL